MEQMNSNPTAESGNALANKTLEELRKAMELHREKCRGPPPSVDQIIRSMDNTHLVVHLILIVMAFTTLAIFIEEIFYLKATIHNNYKRRRMSILQAGIPPIFTLTSAVGMFFPRGNLMIDFVCSVYFGFAMHTLLNLMVNYYGGVSRMITRLKGVKVTISTPPLCCCCKCLPQVDMTRKTFKVLYYLTFQAALSRPIVLFFRGILVLDPTFSVNDMIFIIILAMSMLTGMWALIIFRGVSNQVLAKYHITAKFFCFQSVLLISNIQPFVLKMVSLPCYLPYTVSGRIITLNYQIMVVEFFVISLFTRCLYRTKGDAQDLEHVTIDDDSRDSREIQKGDTSVTFVREYDNANGDEIISFQTRNGKIDDI